MKLVLHPRVEQSLDRITKLGGGSFLFYGHKGVGKSTAALEVASRLGCDRAGGLFMIEPPEDSKSGKIGISQIKKLQEELSLAGYYSGQSRLIMIDPADKMTDEAQNALLKTLEEPPANTLIILIAVDADLLLPTVRSRIQAIYFPVVNETQMSELLSDTEHGSVISRLSRGAPGTAVSLSGDNEGRGRLTNIASLTGKVLKISLFDRLTLIPEILALDPQGSQFLEFLAVAAGKQLREGKLSSKWLEAIERCSRYIAANVNAKAALEGLMVELS